MSTNGSGKVEIIVFDFDGTLAELRLDFADMKRQLSRLAEHYLDCTLPEPSLPVLEWLDVLEALVRKTDERGSEEFRQKARELIVQLELEAARHGRLFPFTRSVLRHLGQNQIATAIITRNCAEAVRIVFQDLDDYCTTFLARDHVPRVKPDPDHLLRALRQANANPDKALMVGDHPLDIQTGKRAGVLTAGVWSGSASHEDLLQSGADWVAKNCDELMEVLNHKKLI
jgi:phosphoglycolate phosphatase